MTEEYQGMGLGIEEMQHGVTVNGTSSLDLHDFESCGEPEESEIDLAFQEAFSHLDETRKEYKATLPPSGTYEVPAGTLTKIVRSVEVEIYRKTETGEFRKVEIKRPILTYSGQGTRVTEEKTWTPRLSFRMSPVIAYGKDAEGQPTGRFDSASALFVKCAEAFEKVYKRKPIDLADIDDFFETYAVRLIAFQLPDGKLNVNGIEGIQA